MQRLYDEANGGTFRSVDPEVIVARMGLKSFEAYSIVQDLVRAQLVYEAPDGEVNFTEAGIREVEQARESPSRETEHFPANVFFNIRGDAYGIQAGTRDSVQQVFVDIDAQLPAIEAFLEELRIRLDELPIPAEQLEVMRADLETVEAQLRSPHPRPTVIRETVLALREVVIGAAGAGAFTGLLELAEHVHL
jgi:hypothetical protein